MQRAMQKTTALSARQKIFSRFFFLSMVLGTSLVVGVKKIEAQNGLGGGYSQASCQAQCDNIPDASSKLQCQTNCPPDGSAGAQAIQQKDDQLKFDQLNPLLIGGGADVVNQTGPSKNATQLSTPGGFISRVLVYAIPASAMILFVMLLWGGFEILAGAATAKSKDAGRQRITAALIGFLLLFVSYWLAQILQIVFGIKIV
jgi:hypothetical protein